MARKLVLIEDDPFVIEWIQRLIKDEFGTAIEMRILSSERAFLVELPTIRQDRPFAIIVDYMLPWEDGVEISTDAHATPRGDHFVAGTRIVEDLNTGGYLKNVAVLLYTVNDRPPETANVQYMRKDEPDERLIAWIRAALRART